MPHVVERVVLLFAIRLFPVPRLVVLLTAGVRARRRAASGGAARQFVRDARRTSGRLGVARGGAGGARQRRRAARGAGGCVEEGQGTADARRRRVSGWRSRSPRGANGARSNAIGRAAGSSTMSACAKSWCGCRARSRRWPACRRCRNPWCASAARSCWRWCATAGISDPPPPLPRRERPDPALLATAKRLADITAERGRGARDRHRKCWPRVASWKDSPPAAGRQPAARLARGRDRKEAAVSALTCGARAPVRGTCRVLRARLRATLRTWLVDGARAWARLLRRLAHRAARRLAGPRAAPPCARPLRACFAGRFGAARRAHAAARAERVEQALRDLVDGAFGVDGAHQAGIRVVMRHRLARVFLVLAQALLEGVFVIVGALHQAVFGAARHALAGRRRRS